MGNQVAQLNSELRGRVQPCTDNISCSDLPGIVENEGGKSKEHKKRGRRQHQNNQLIASNTDTQNNNIIGAVVVIATDNHL